MNHVIGTNIGIWSRIFNTGGDGAPPAVDGALLLEDGGYFLLEDGSYALLEDGIA